MLRGVCAGLALLAAPCLGAGAMFLLSGNGIAAAQDSAPPAKERRSEAKPTPDPAPPVSEEADRYGVRVMTLAEKECRERKKCPMRGPCPACPR